MNRKLVVLAALITTASIAGGLWYWKHLEKSSQGKAAYTHTANILALGPRPAGSDGLKDAHRYLSSELANHGWTTITQSVDRDTPVGKRTFINLIARYDAAEIQSIDDVVKLPTTGILSAHLDSKIIPDAPHFLGADDAASACALMLELAISLSKENPELAKNLELVFFDGEEAFNKNMSLATGDGLYGSRAYAISLYHRSPKPQFAIVLDMVGHKDLKIAVPSDTPTALLNSLMRAAENKGHQKHFSQAQYPILDDHYYLSKAGVPAIDIIGANFTDSHWWHQSADNMALISAESLQISYDVVITMLRDLLAK